MWHLCQANQHWGSGPPKPERNIIQITFIRKQWHKRTPTCMHAFIYTKNVLLRFVTFLAMSTKYKDGGHTLWHTWLIQCLSFNSVWHYLHCRAGLSIMCHLSRWISALACIGSRALTFDEYFCCEINLYLCTVNYWNLQLVATSHWSLYPADCYFWNVNDLLYLIVS